MTNDFCTLAKMTQLSKEELATHLDISLPTLYKLYKGEAKRLDTTVYFKLLKLAKDQHERNSTALTFIIANKGI